MIGKQQARDLLGKRSTTPPIVIVVDRNFELRPCGLQEVRARLPRHHPAAEELARRHDQVSRMLERKDDQV